MNFKTIIRAAKLPLYKMAFTVLASEGTVKVATADGYIMVWEPSTEALRAINVDDEEVEYPNASTVGGAKLIIEQMSPPLEEMIKVNSDKLRRVISALETKGQAPLYLDLKERRICLAYEQDGVISRAVVACMKNGGEDGADVQPANQCG